MCARVNKSLAFVRSQQKKWANKTHSQSHATERAVSHWSLATDERKFDLNTIVSRRFIANANWSISAPAHTHNILIKINFRALCVNQFYQLNGKLPIIAWIAGNEASSMRSWLKAANSFSHMFFMLQFGSFHHTFSANLMLFINLFMIEREKKYYPDSVDSRRRSSFSIVGNSKLTWQPNRLSNVFGGGA